MVFLRPRMLRLCIVACLVGISPSFAFFSPTTPFPLARLPRNKNHIQDDTNDLSTVSSSVRKGLRRFSWGMKSDSDSEETAIKVTDAQPLQRSGLGGAAAATGFLWDRRKWLLQTLLGAVLALPILGELYARAAAPFIDFGKVRPASFESSSSAGQITLVFHGAGGVDKNTDALMETLQTHDDATNEKRRNGNDSRRSVSNMIDWFAYSSNVLQASFNGQRIGRRYAEKLMKEMPNLETVHIIGISVGAFAADAAVVELKKQNRNLFVQETLLDPFCLRGVVDGGYGTRNYGKAADYAQQFLNTVRSNVPT